MQKAIIPVTEADDSHAEGYQCTSKGVASHSEGGECTTNGAFAHAEAKSTTANGGASHTEGKRHLCSLDFFSCGRHGNKRRYAKNQHVQGRFNAGSMEYAHIVGNGKVTLNVPMRTLLIGTETAGLPE